MDKNENLHNDLSPEKKSEIMINNLKKLRELSYADFKPVESYRIYENLRGKSSE